MVGSFEAGTSSGTKINKYNQVFLYMSFMIACSFNALSPDLLSVMLYSQFLFNSFTSVQSIKNYMSGPKVYLRDRGHNFTAFCHPSLKTLINGFKRLSDHVPRRAPALSTKTLKKVIDLLSALSVEGQVAASSLLFGTCSFLRQSNFLGTQWLYDNPHMVRRCDVKIEKHTMWINVMSTKTLARAKAVSIPIPRIHGSKYCPVKSCVLAMQLVKGSPEDPIFLSPYTQAPMTAARVTALLRLALHVMKHPAATSATVHSTRRSGAQICAKAGATQEDVETHGTWASRASEVYAPKRLYSSIPSIMSKAFK